MEKFTTKSSVQQYVQQQRASGKTIGFVATMGALHAGHISLIDIARRHCDIVISSIFVNPTQFNDTKDLEKYPRPIAVDVAMLEQAGCDALFNPEVEEMYSGDEGWHLDIGELEHLLEGRSRPGHYQGVMQVVHKLFTIVKPDEAFFGQKDYQQFMVINKMTALMKMPVKLVMCPIVREPDGLAMSSRNIHLSADDRRHSLVLSQTLNQVYRDFDPASIAGLQDQAMQTLYNEEGVEPDYFVLVDGDTLHPANQNTQKVVALVAAKVGNTRLIDNVIVQ
ncbi:pantoate--beta-alanine ligase [Mucilaginibacter hurinus]|uniref:Pantothenate synthetase n=1 Tax=Mucilaginibacter hurinus TaxID=2201324 RepID=A0A367GQA2_9SPHI|nr:pantoate--beta-alanine ligase [Mucilaginibacter hurinus]RCH55629.1 pantoate--beta-alanine ligase [Mucilaginibacter hurinus]